MDAPVVSMEVFRQVHALECLSVKASISSPEASRDAASVHGAVEAVAMDGSMEHPLVLLVEVVEVASMEAFTEACVAWK